MNRWTLSRVLYNNGTPDMPATSHKQGDAHGRACKFDELRIKTGNQLLRVVNNQLDLGIREAGQALRSAYTWVVAEDHYRRAKGTLAEASHLIPLVGEILGAERVQCEARLEHLREMLA
jgi:hypothetical protein